MNQELNYGLTDLTLGEESQATGIVSTPPVIPGTSPELTGSGRLVFGTLILVNQANQSLCHCPRNRNSVNYDPMFANIRQDYYYLNHVPSDPGSRALARGNSSLPVTSLVFDSREELLWMGNSGGHVTSYYGLGLQKYTSFQVVQDSGPGSQTTTDIRSQLTGDYGLLSLTSNSLRMSMRRGLTIFHHNSDLFKDMYCMSHLDNSDLILMGGQQVN